MAVIIISGVRIVRELLLDYFSRIRLLEVRAAESLEMAGPVAARDVLLVHAEGPVDALVRTLDRLDADGVRTGGDRPLILIVPAGLLREASGRLGHRVRALLPDDASPAALFGAACVVAEGFDVEAHGAADGVRGRLDAMPLPVALDAADTAPPWSDRLSPQESRILLGLVRGRSNKEIANELGIREATVKVHVRTCFEKIGVRNRTQAALWASERLHELGADARRRGPVRA